MPLSSGVGLAAVGSRVLGYFVAADCPCLYDSLKIKAPTSPRWDEIYLLPPGCRGRWDYAPHAYVNCFTSNPEYHVDHMDLKIVTGRVNSLVVLWYFQESS